jgi:hypothetical protein
MTSDIQVFHNSCVRDFTVNFGLKRMEHSPHAVTAAMQLYFSGESLRNTARSLRPMSVQAILICCAEACARLSSERP